ncbi:chemotaxis protein CheA [Pilimelia terevasa]|uniref:histidine kinase n=1 Tax=Pilimelia terevasa TaxID=53372 RepID=A0A8J3BFD3_9ACTN|nr:chemotaxis protein CheA [Pilimelia terevasa]GGK17908.1 chemotaxis protein CheA [Pilimelia terevasa]
MDDLGEIVDEFLVESHENLDQLDGDLVALEREPSRDLLSSIFRTIHTIKGTSGFLAFGRLEALTHAGESLLSRLRDGVQPVTPETITALLAMVDGVRALLASIEEGRVEGDIPIDGLVAQVNAQIADAAAPPADAPPADAAAGTGEATVSVDAPAGAPDEEARRPLGELLVESGAAVDTDVNWALEKQTGGDERRLGAILLDEGKTNPAAVNDALAAQGRRSVADATIRVDVDLLDSLMNLVGELVLVRNQLVRAATDAADPVIVRTTQRLNLITSELQEGIMKTRMQPIEQLWLKLPRVVRDLSTTFGKQVRVAMVGAETELDRSLLEAVKDPLTHLVRNAVDHGIESPEQRVAAGKSAEGTLTLKAYHESGHVTVEVIDDGAGIDVEKVRAKAVERGILAAAEAARMEPREVMMQVFAPGFSTAEKVTNVSGRGVGMDVVKTNIERIGGAVDVDSTLGEGTVWRLTIPLTLAIIQALTIDSGDDRYVIPQVAVHELVYVDGENTRIEYVSGAPVYRLRGKLLPLVRLDAALGRPAGTDDRGVYIVVLQADGRRFGVVVDRVLNTEEVVVKALTSRFKEIGIYAGATILGDGKVALILDVPALARRSQLSADLSEEDDAAAESADDSSRLLVTAVGARRIAVPLDTVTRLEQFAAEAIEWVGNREVVQYRGRILPLVRLSSLLGVEAAPPGDTVSAVVYTERGRSIALVVDGIDDIVESTTTDHEEVDDHGILGSTVIAQRVTELLDVRRAILAADPQFYATTGESVLTGAWGAGPGAA